MTRFIDGPAAGIVLQIRRQPIFLRVTQDAKTGKWDALDQESDSPIPSENIFVYVLHKNLGSCHIRSGKPGMSGFYPISEYAHYSAQPSDAQMRSNSQWNAWRSDKTEASVNF